MDYQSPRNLGIDLVRATEAAAIRVGHFGGAGTQREVDRVAGQAMLASLNTLNMRGTIVIGEESQTDEGAPLTAGMSVGTGVGPEMDVVVDPIDGRRLLADGRPGALSVAVVAEKGSIWAPTGSLYMEKLVVDSSIAQALVPECLDAPIGWTLALIARQKQKSLKDLLIFVLERPRHQDLIEEIRSSGARVILRSDGDIAGGLIAASADRNIDAMVGIGGTSEGVIAACAVKALRGAMLGRLAPQSEEEQQNIQKAGLDANRILTADELVKSQNIFFATTGITDGNILKGIRYRNNIAYTQSIILRGETGTRRTIHAEHLLPDE